jgi:hypothetical protein
MAECACGRTFAPTRSDAKYCSGACRQWGYRRRKSALDGPQAAQDGLLGPARPNEAKAAPGPALRTASGQIVDIRSLVG